MPVAELCAARGADAETDGEDDVKAVEGDRFLGIINVQKMHIVRLIQLALGKDVLDML